MRRLETVTDGVVRLPGGVVYPALWALEAEGLVTRRRVARANGRGRAAEVYALTEAGRAHGAAQRAAMLALLGEGRA